MGERREDSSEGLPQASELALLVSDSTVAAEQAEDLMTVTFEATLRDIEQSLATLRDGDLPTALQILKQEETALRKLHGLASEATVVTLFSQSQIKRIEEGDDPVKVIEGLEAKLAHIHRTLNEASGIVFTLIDKFQQGTSEVNDEKVGEQITSFMDAVRSSLMALSHNFNDEVGMLRAITEELTSLSERGFIPVSILEKTVDSFRLVWEQRERESSDLQLKALEALHALRESEDMNRQLRKQLVDVTRELHITRRQLAEGLANSDISFGDSTTPRGPRIPLGLEDGTSPDRETPNNLSFTGIPEEGSESITPHRMEAPTRRLDEVVPMEAENRFDDSESEQIPPFSMRDWLMQTYPESESVEEAAQTIKERMGINIILDAEDSFAPFASVDRKTSYRKTLKGAALVAMPEFISKLSLFDSVSAIKNGDIPLNFFNLAIKIIELETGGNAYIDASVTPHRIIVTSNLRDSAELADLSLRALRDGSIMLGTSSNAAISRGQLCFQAESFSKANKRLLTPDLNKSHNVSINTEGDAPFINASIMAQIKGIEIREEDSSMDIYNRL